MTGAEFTARYRLREQLNDGSVATFRAIDGRGAKVFVHVFRDTSAPDFDPASLDSQGTAMVREVLDVEGITVVVTGEIESFSSFQAWTADRQRKEAGEPGAYTRIFRVDEPAPEPTEERAAPTPLTHPAPVAPDAVRGRKDARPEPPEAGEYTLLFGAADPGPPKRPDPVEHSTYSRIMRPASGPPAAPATPSPIYPPRPPEPPPPISRPLPEAHPTGSNSGAYTMIMRTGGVPQEPPPLARHTAPLPPPRPRETLDSDLYADNYLHRLRTSGPDTGPQSIPAPPETPRFDRSLYESPPAADPGSYTMIIGKGAQPAAPLMGLGQVGYPAAPPPPPAPSGPPPKAKSKTPLIVMLVLVVAILITLILFLALRPRP